LTAASREEQNRLSPSGPQVDIVAVIVTAEKNKLSEGTDPAQPRLVAGSQPASAEPIRLGVVQSGGDTEEPDPAREPMLRAQQGDHDAFRTLVEMFQNRVMRVMVSVLHCDRAMAEDLSQEVFMRVHKGLPGFDGQVRFAAWLHTISMNVAISEYRRRRTQKRDRRTLSIDAPVKGTDDFYITLVGHERDPSDTAHRKEFLAKVRTCVSELPDEYREAVILRDMESLSYEEIAEALSLPMGTVRSRIHRGRLVLQQKLREFHP
jgi:RNA polymerase sigma-70 factor (ECF subfamily)